MATSRANGVMGWPLIDGPSQVAKNLPKKQVH
jgi:hypothetical protein